MIIKRKNYKLINYLMVFLILVSGTVLAQAPAAGTIIKNQASATYTDSSGIEQTTTSNLVETVVQQVGAFELVQNQSRIAIEGQVVSFPHVLTNTGNGNDSFALTSANAGGDDYDFLDFNIYPDVNQDGVADSNVPITDTGTLAADEAFYFVVSATVPTGLVDTDIGSLTVDGTSAFLIQKSIDDGVTPASLGATITNTDDAIVSDDAVIRVTKSISTNSGQPGSGPYTVTLTYSNPSTIDATDVTLIDALPAGMEYVPGSGVWSLTGSLTDVAGLEGTAPDTVNYCAYQGACANQVEAVVSSVVSGDSGTISFSIRLAAGLSVSTLINTAEFSYNNGTVVVPNQETNPVPVDITAQPGVVANGTPGSNVDGTNPPTQTTATLGSTVAFDNIIWNTGNDTDIFDISIDPGSSYPPGTTFALYKSDGFTPLLDNDNSGVVDTGPLAVGASYVVVLKARLPMSATPGNLGYSVTKTATSAIDPNVNNSVTDTLNTITGSTVDMTNDAPAGDVLATGVGPMSTTAQTTLDIAPGSSDVFKLYVNNSGGVADSFDLAYSIDNAFDAGTLPVGWTVLFYTDGGAADCSTLGAVVNNTSVIAAGGNVLICAEVSIASDVAFTNAPVSIYFRAKSPLTNAVDIKHDAVLIGATQKLILEPDNFSQIEPGRSVVYTHLLSNPGNTDYTDLTLVSSNTLDSDGWTSVLYEDTDGDGQLGANDQPVVGPYVLTPGETKTIFAKVFAPANAPYGASNITNIVATGTTDTGTVVIETVRAKDTTTVAKSNMKIDKRQAPDLLCDGIEDSAFSFAAFEAQPGTCVIYSLTATNTSVESAHNVRIDDSIPEYTTHFLIPGNVPTMTPGTMTSPIPAEGETGMISGNAGTVLPGGTATLNFGVRVE